MQPKFTKGGRGKVAPYQSTHVRVPEPIKHLIDAIIEAYKLNLQYSRDGGEDFVIKLRSFAKGLNQDWDDSPSDNYNENELVSIASQILRQKKSARVSLEKLLTTILDKNISIPPS